MILILKKTCIDLSSKAIRSLHHFNMSNSKLEDRMEMVDTIPTIWILTERFNLREQLDRSWVVD